MLFGVLVRECMLGTPPMAKRTISSLNANRLLQGAAIAIVALSVAGCANQPKKELTTGSISGTSKSVQSMTASELSQAAEGIGQAYEKNPRIARRGSTTPIFCA